MLIPKKNRKEVYKYLFRGAYPGDELDELSIGVLTGGAEDFPHHVPTLTPVPPPSTNHRGCHLCQEGLQSPRAP
jgi:hypothetical protein